jgi:hypothetical protein
LYEKCARKMKMKLTTGSLKSCSIRALLSRLPAGGLITNYDVLIGQKSIGKLLESEGFAALPGPTYPIAGVTFINIL